MSVPTEREASASPTIAEHLLSRLVAAGAGHLFGVPGDYNLRLLDAVTDHPGIAWVGGANELGAAYSADGYARIRGFGAVLTTYGVGELSALNGLAGSAAESVPVLHIVGSPTTAVQRAGTPVHHSLLDGDAGHFVRAVDEVVCASTVLTAENAADEIDRVITAVLEQKRPGSISVPADLVDLPVQAGHRDDPRARSASDPAALSAFGERAAALLAGADSVVVLADHLASRHGVSAELDALARVANVRSATTAPGKGVLDETAPGFLGLYIGSLSDEPVRAAVEEADVVVGVGLRWADLSSGGFTTRLDPARLVDVRPWQAVIGGGVADGVRMADALGVLRRILGARLPLPARSERPVLGVGQPAGGPLTQGAFWERFGRFLRPGDIVAADQGTPFYGLVTLPLPAGVDVIAQPLWASIGYALPASLGAQLGAEGRRRTVLVTGDGAAQMTVQELGTIIRNGLDPVVIVLNNDGYTVERAINGWTAAYNDVARWDWSVLPAALGAGAETVVRRVVTVAELDAALAECDANAGKLTFVEVVLDRYDLPALLDRTAHAVARQNA